MSTYWRSGDRAWYSPPGGEPVEVTIAGGIGPVDHERRGDMKIDPYDSCTIQLPNGEYKVADVSELSQTRPSSQGDKK